jgi:hypothetical protein
VLSFRRLTCASFSTKRLVLAFFAVAMTGCISHIDQRKLEPVASGERVDIAAPLKAIENRGLVKLEWQLLPGTYVEKFSSSFGRVFLSEGRLVQATTTLGEKGLHPGGFIILKDRPGFGRLYVVRGKSGREMIKSPLLDVSAGVEGDLTLITDFPLSDIKRR